MVSNPEKSYIYQRNNSFNYDLAGFAEVFNITTAKNKTLFTFVKFNTKFTSKFSNYFNSNIYY